MGGRRQPDGMSEANLRRPTTHRASGLVKKSLKPKYFPDFFQLTLKRRNLYEFCRKFIDIRKIIFILAKTTWDIVPKHY